MLDRLLVSLGSAAIGGALVYFLWSFVTRRLSQLRARRAARRADAAPPAVSVETLPVTPPETRMLDDIRASIGELARAQVSMMERLEQAAEDRRPGAEDPNEARFVALSAKIDALGAGDVAVADALEALGSRLTAIEEGVSTLVPAEDDDDRDAAMADAMEALVNRLEGVEAGLGSVGQLIETAAASGPDPQAQADALRAVLESALPSDGLPALENRLSEKLGALSAQLEAAGAAATDDTAARQLAARLDALEAQLAAAAEQRAAERETLDILSEGLSELLDQLERPAEIAFSEAALAELQGSLRDSAQPSEQGQGAALAEALATLDSRLAALETHLAAIGPGGAETVASLARNLERLTQPDLHAPLVAALQAERTALADTIAGAPAAQPTPAEQAGSSEHRPEPSPVPHSPATGPASVPPFAGSHASQPPGDTTDAGVSGTRPGPAPAHPAFGLSGTPSGTAEPSRAESALFRARSGFTTVIGPHAQAKPNGPVL